MADWINRQVKNATSAVGNAAGGVVNAVGNGVSAAGQNAGKGITNTTTGWASSTREYGNSIKDATNASGVRASTAQNPLGLTRGQASAKGHLSGAYKGRNTGGGSGRDPLGLGK
ncbi:hypothetical protein K402DRAFT_461041 [Aulographum hederae CBS 113979]|uniref:Uncharacterized protein n=1 Tax=Aulographum hederae CBS 113979 TaxID=1176131 RepID=A0A6G1H9T2_9PEZI|nr:hypothetical protein K402DRAFT_461041 [Aulographum hederae CBS 113979]